MMHNGADLGHKSCRKVAQEYYCKKCDYTTCKLSSWKKHIKTKKHNGAQMVHNDSKKVAKKLLEKNILVNVVNPTSIIKDFIDTKRHVLTLMKN